MPASHLIPTNSPGTSFKGTFTGASTHLYKSESAFQNKERKKEGKYFIIWKIPWSMAIPKSVGLSHAVMAGMVALGCTVPYWKSTSCHEVDK